MNLALPLNFGDRACDRLFVAKLGAVVGGSSVDSKPIYLWSAFMVWKDFGIARDDRRKVPMDADLRAKCDTVVILEQYCGWNGAPGFFVECGIQSGFFELVALDDEYADLVLVDFFPANRSESRNISAAKLGGISKGVNIAREKAKSAADEQLALFEQQDSPLLKGHARERVRNGLFLVHQICRNLRRNPPVAHEWRDSLTRKAMDILDSTTERDRELVFRWFSANRDSQKIPPRLDFVMNEFSNFLSEAKKDFGE